MIYLPFSLERYSSSSARIYSAFFTTYSLSELIVVQGNKVGFVHQSILDYFISQNMLEKYYDGSSIEEIIGEKSRQTPTKRYQVQMF